MSSGTAPGTPPGSSSGTSDEMARMPKKSSSMMWVAVVIVVVIVLAAVGYAYYAGWIGPKKTQAATCTPATLLAGGSTFVFPLMNAWTQTYAQQTCVQVNYQSVGSGSGISGLGSGGKVGAYVFGASDAPLNPSQRAGLAGPALTIPEAAGAVVVTYNVPGLAKGTVLNLTGSVIAKIYLGNITNWNDPAIAAINAGVTLPNLAISPVYRTGSSGTTFAFTSYLTLVSSAWASKVGKGVSVNFPVGSGASGSTGVAGQVSLVKGAVGYVELTYALLNTLSYAKVQNPAGNFIQANVSNTQAAVLAGAGNLPAGNGDWYNVTLLNETGAQTYPIATFTYVLVYTNLGVYGSALSQSQADLLVKFIWWIVHSGQSQCPLLFYVSLPANVVALDETTIGEINYNGAALPSH